VFDFAIVFISPQAMGHVPSSSDSFLGVNIPYAHSSYSAPFYFPSCNRANHPSILPVAQLDASLLQLED